MPRHVPSSFVASGGKACYCPMHLMPDVETSLKTLGQCSTKILVRRTWTPSHKLHSQQAGVAFIIQSIKLVSAKMNFMAIREIYSLRKLPAIR